MAVKIHRIIGERKKKSQTLHDNAKQGQSVPLVLQGISQLQIMD